MLEVRGVDVFYGEAQALFGVDLLVADGEVVCIVGPNGAGKTTLVYAIAGMLPIARGSVEVGGAAVAGQPAHLVCRSGVAIVPEGRRLLPELTVEDNLRVATYAMSREEGKKGLEYALELFPQLKKRWQSRARLLSGGEQQMVVLAQALASQPTTLLVDELSLGLAPVVVKRLVPTLEEVASSGVGVLLIEQFAQVALGMANAAYVLEGGRIRYSGTAAELRDNPELLSSAYLLRELEGGDGAG